MEIKIHSIIDIITNSSTEIFTTTNDNAIQHTKELILAIQKLVYPNADMSDVDDLFEFEIKVQVNAYESVLENWLDNMPAGDRRDVIIQMPIEEQIQMLICDPEEDENYREYGPSEGANTIIIKTKTEDQESMDLLEYIDRIFHSYEGERG